MEKIFTEFHGITARLFELKVERQDLEIGPGGCVSDFVDHSVYGVGRVGQILESKLE